MEKVEKIFNEWAKNGRAELMEIEHGKNVSKFLQTVSFDKPFTFLDVGCGNGWVVKKITKEKNCQKSTGIDKSRNMILQAKIKAGNKTRFICTDIESWKYNGKFDFVFSMESLYYADSIKVSLEKIFKLLKPGGQFFCGIEFYTDNKATARWAKIMNVQMHLHSKKEWRQLFCNVGFKVRTRHIKDWKSKKKWKREFGTFFITGTKPEK